MQMELTNRDKKLLVFLAIFVLVVGMGYWGIYPHIKSIRTTIEKKEEARELQEEYARKVAELDLVKTDNDKLRETIEEERQAFYESMTSDKIDKYFTDMALSYKLAPYDLDIQIADGEADLSPYIYAETQEDTEEESTEETGITDSSKQTAQVVEEIDSDGEEEEDTVSNGICIATVTQRLVGTRKQFNKLIDDLSSRKEMLRVKAYSYGEEENIIGTNQKNYKLGTQNVLNLTVEIYMCL